MIARMAKRILVLMLCDAVLAVGLVTSRDCHAAETDTVEPPAMKSQIVRWDDATAKVADWGEMRRYFSGHSFGTKNVLTAVAVIEPGQSVHKAHRHAEEEYLVLIEGTGTWTLDGEDSAAEKGDILYTEPWIYHGLTNTGDQKLIFLVIRFSGKGVDPPPRPDDRPDEL